MMNDLRMLILSAPFYAEFETLHININYVIELYNTDENYLVSMICCEYFNDYSVILWQSI